MSSAELHKYVIFQNKYSKKHTALQAKYAVMAKNIGTLGKYDQRRLQK